MLDEMFKAVKDFNTIAGNKDVSIKGFKTQQRNVYEECIKEVEEALYRNNPVKLLDGVVDGLYVVLGQLAKLEALGCDIKGAIEQVCTDNMKKFPLDEEVAEASVSHYASQNIRTNWQYNPEHGRYVIKDDNKKIRKPLGFTATDLSQYVPKELQEKGLKYE